MGVKYTTEAISGYNSSPPVSDGTQSEANKVKWATHKDKLADPIKDQVANIDTKLVAMVDIGPDAKATDYTTVAGDHQKTIEVTAASVTTTLLAVSSAPAGCTVTIKNSSGSTTDIDATGSEEIAGSTGTIMLADDEILIVQLNQAQTGYNVLQQPDSTIISSAQVYKGAAAGTADVITVSLTPTLSALTDGTVCFVKALLANATTTPTINMDGLGAKTITKDGSQALAAGDIARVDDELILRYNAGNAEWELLNSNPQISSGTWTPSIQDSTYSDAEAQTYYTNVGYYTRVGNMVMITGRLHVNSIGTLTTSDPAVIGGLPFDVGFTAGQQGSISIASASSLSLPSALSISGQASTLNSVGKIELKLWETTAGPTDLLVSEVSAGADLRFSGVYNTDA